jgi:mono/diheme cytochrome c family protein
MRASENRVTGVGILVMALLASGGAVVSLLAADPPAGRNGPSSLAQEPPGGPQLYAAACAACHGGDGTGAPRERVGFDIPLPDFTDCSFATREPDDDWLAVVHEGGPARAFDAMMPAFGDALTEDEMRRVLHHVRSFCASGAWPRGELNLPRALVTEKAYPEDEAVLTTTVDTGGSGAVLNEIVYERRFGARNHVEVAVPFGARGGDPGRWSGGVGDIAIGLKRVLYHSLERGAIFSAIGEVVLPTGSSGRGLGKGVTVIEPSAAFGQLLPAEAFLQFQGGFELATDRDRAEHEAFWRVVAGRTLTRGRFGRAWSPMLEVLGSRELATGHRVHWDLLPQVQVTLSTRQHIMLNAGLRVPIGERAGRPTRLMVYLLWDWFDGGFFEGW